MKKKVVLLFLLSSHYLGLCQNYIPYYNVVNEAEYWLYKGQYKKAQYLYSKAFAIEKPFGKDLYLAARCFALQKKGKQCLKFLKKSATKTASYPSLFIIRDSLIFAKVFKDPNKLKKISKELQLIEFNHNKRRKDYKYFMLQDTVLNLVERDRKFQSRVKVDSNGSVKKNSISNDSVLQAEFINVIEKYGYPGYSVIGTDIASEILVHFSDENYFNYKNLIFNELKRGKVLPYEYGRMIDRIEYAPYNSICFLFLHTQGKCSVQDYPQIIRNRMSIGLSIYFEGIRKTPFEPNVLLPWVNEETILNFSNFSKK